MTFKKFVKILIERLPMLLFAQIYYNIGLSFFVLSPNNFTLSRKCDFWQDSQNMLLWICQGNLHIIKKRNT